MQRHAAPRRQVGQANGIMAATMAAGASSGFLFTFVEPNQNRLYLLYIVLGAVCVPITLAAARERPARA